MKPIALFASFVALAALLAPALAESPKPSPPPNEADPLARICDAAGVGYQLIPGTTTCIKIGGYVRVDVTGSSGGASSPSSGVATGADH